ncbi:MAG: ethanolamine ammonia-lyase subunit EutC [Chitinophagaceae bacterium]
MEPGQLLKQPAIQEDPWQSLRAFTGARIALGRTGAAIPLREVLQLRMAHAHARDAVFSKLDVEALQSAFQSYGLPVYTLHSRAGDRAEYLQRPDKGRQLDEEAIRLLQTAGEKAADIVIVLADGLSADAVNRHAAPLLQLLLPLFRQSGHSIGSLCLVQQGRVAIADEIGSRLQARLSLLLIGERPGLSSPESLGIYLTYQPRPGLTDEMRNCISNIHAAGLSYTLAAEKINGLVNASLRLRLSGIRLKEGDHLLL